MDKSEIKPILDKVPEDMDIELNVSCPNTEESMVKEGLKPFLNNKIGVLLNYLQQKLATTLIVFTKWDFGNFVLEIHYYKEEVYLAKY